MKMYCKKSFNRITLNSIDFPLYSPYIHDNTGGWIVQWTPFLNSPIFAGSFNAGTKNAKVRI